MSLISSSPRGSQAPPEPPVRMEQLGLPARPGQLALQVPLALQAPPASKVLRARLAPLDLLEPPDRRALLALLAQRELPGLQVPKAQLVPQVLQVLPASPVLKV